MSDVFTPSDGTAGARMHGVHHAVQTTLHEVATRRALEAARSAQFTTAEWEIYAWAKVAGRDARRALQFAEARGECEWEGRRAAAGDRDGV